MSSIYCTLTIESIFADVRTQAMYQQLDPGFIGLIFSCFSEDAQKVSVKWCSFIQLL